MPRKVAYIHTLLRSDDFYEVAELVRAEPEQAAALNSANSSPLGVLVKNATCGTVCTAIHQNIPRFVEGFELALDALVTACPAAVGHGNKYGDTPLVIACRDSHISSTGTSASTTYQELMKWAVERMIDAFPAAVRIPDRNSGNLPIHYVLDMGYGGPMDIVVKLVRAYPESLLQQNGWGSSIVPMLVDNLHSSDTCIWGRIKTLVSLCPASALTQNQGRCNAIQALWFKIRNRPDYLARQQPGVQLPRIPERLSDDMITDIANKMTESQDHSDGEFYSKAYELLLFLLKAASQHTDTSSDDNDNVANTTFRAVAAAAGLEIPAELLRLLIALFPNQVREVDENGQLPLHIAASGPWKSRGFGEIDRPTGIEILVQEFPSAVRVLDSNWNIPLHLALLKKPTSWHLGIQALVQADPRTLRITNANGMYPFQLAAEGNNYINRWDGLRLVYEMVRTDPQVLQLASRPQQQQHDS